MAGLALSAFLVPVGMGYAEASGLPAIYGLYATIVPLLVYGLLGPSRILVLGPDSALAPLIAATILPLSHGDPSRALALAGMLAIPTGAFLVLIGVIRFGYVTDLLSLPIRYGYLNGIALAVIVSQLPKVFGFSVDAEGSIGSSWPSPRGRRWARGPSCAVDRIEPRSSWSSSCAGWRRACRACSSRSPCPWPRSRSSGSPTRSPSSARCPEGCRRSSPLVETSDLPSLSAAAIGIALVAFADTSVLSRTFASRLGRDVNPNHEVIALGLANAATGLFQGFPISSSASRTPVAESAGARTQLTGLVGAAVIALLLVAAPSLFADLPQAALGGIVIVAATSLIEIRGVIRLARVRSPEFWLSIACFLGVAVLGVIPASSCRSASRSASSSTERGGPTTRCSGARPAEGYRR